MKAYHEVNTQAGTGDSGMLLTNKNYKGRVQRLNWTKMNRLRLTGPAEADMKSIQPWRYGPEDNHFGPFFIAAPIFRGGTSRRVTFIAAMRDPNDPTDYLDPELNPSPIMKFYDRVRKEAYDNANLERALLRGGNGQSAALPNPRKVHGLLQGINLRDKNGRIVPDFPTMFVLTPSARQQVEDLLNTQVEGYTGDPDDYNARFVVGDITGADTGRPLMIYNPDEVQTRSSSASIDWDAASKEKKSSAMEVSHYTVEMMEAVMPLPRNEDGRLRMAVAGTLFTPWNDCIHLFDEREMFDLVVQAFEDYPALLYRAFSDQLDWLPAKVRQAAEAVIVNGHAGVQPIGPANTPAAPGIPGAQGAGAQSVADAMIPPEVQAALQQQQIRAQAPQQAAAQAQAPQQAAAQAQAPQQAAAPVQTTDTVPVDWNAASDGAASGNTPDVGNNIDPASFAQDVAAAGNEQQQQPQASQTQSSDDERVAAAMRKLEELESEG